MKELTYYVTKDGIMPGGIIDAGFAGEHNATTIKFNLSEELSEADEYYLYITNGGGEFYASDCLYCADNCVYYDLPNYVTAISGICKLQLIIKRDDVVAFMFPCEIKILPSAEKTIGAIHYLSDISDALSICKSTSDLAQKTLNIVNDNSDIFVQKLGDIELALDEIINIQNDYIGR